MEINQIKKFDILINPKMGFCGYVIRIGQFVTLRSLSGAEMTFGADYLEPAPPDKVAEFAGKVPADVDAEADDSASQKAERSAEEARTGLAKYISGMAAEHPDSAENFKSFWDELMTILGDKPGKTWDMRWGAKDANNVCPLLMAPSKKTNNWVIWVYLLGWENVYIEMRTEYIPEEHLSFFPRAKRMRGTTRAFKMTWAEFNAGPRAKFLEIVRTISSIWRGGL